MSAATPPALKDIFNPQQFRHIAQETAAVHPGFDTVRFLELCLNGLEALSLMQRLRRATQSLHATLPSDYRASVQVLRQLAPRMTSPFATLTLPDFVGLYGLDDADFSMDALRFFTVFGSSEFGVRPFLRQDPRHALAIMETWSRDDNEHVRRLASEGCRPRLPWSFRLDALVKDPALTAPILANLRADPSLYVRKSVANHLNDISKDHPAWLMGLLEGWQPNDARAAWVTRQALRTLIKQGNPRALALVGAAHDAQVAIHSLHLGPPSLKLGERLTLSFGLTSEAAHAQTLVVDYAIHYVKKSGQTSPKVFKLKTLCLPPGAEVRLERSQVIKNFTTRVHYPGRHKVEVLVNGQTLASGTFDLLP